MLRIDIRDYPGVAAREALLNLLVHRDYSFSASALISIYADRIEFVSVGGLLPRIELEDVLVGLSVCRNQNLANVFYRLQLIEAYGTGMRKIIKAYENVEEKPLIETTKNAFKITLPNINAKYETDNIPGSEGAFAIDFFETNAGQRYDNEHIILEYVRNYGKITRTAVENLLEVSALTISLLPLQEF